MDEVLPPRGASSSGPWLQVHIKIQRLIEVDAPSYFETDMLVSISWEDLRIAATCLDMKPGDSGTDTVCGYNRQPQLEFSTALANDDAPIITDIKTSLYAGAERVRRLFECSVRAWRC